MSLWTHSQTTHVFLCTCSRAYDSTTKDEDDEEVSNAEEETSPPPRYKLPTKKGKSWKQKFVMVDENGTPYGKATTFLATDVKLLAKQMNPCYGWARQPLHEKQHFFKQLYSGNSFIS